jgi:hypothetical protein
MMKKQRVTGTDYDLGDGELCRILRIAALNKVVPMGNLGGGPGLRCLVILCIVHRFGNLLFRMIMPQEERLTRIYTRLRGR